MEPFFFGDVSAARFGMYHPTEGPQASTAVVLCYPLGHEYLRAHRAFRNLSQSLSRAGLPVLRFDYVGSGDSGGDPQEVGLAQWQTDIDAAVVELKRRAGVSRVSLVGLRFGATLAALAAARRSDVETVVCWDPVLSGRAYLDELRAVQRRWLRDRLGPDAKDATGPDSELVGMPVPPSLLDEIGRLDVRAVSGFNARRLCIVVSSAREDCEAWLGDLRARGIDGTYHHVPSAGDWFSPDAVHQLLLPHEILRHIANLITSEVGRT